MGQQRGRRRTSEVLHSIVEDEVHERVVALEAPHHLSPPIELNCHLSPPSASRAPAQMRTSLSMNLLRSRMDSFLDA